MSYFKEDLWDGGTGGMGMTDMAQEMNKGQALMNTVTIFRFHKMRGFC
jgi:hypothetical protein